MKRSILIFVICYFCQYVVSQDTRQRDSIMYKTAYEYIVNDSVCKNKQIVVSDSICDLERYGTAGLEQFPEEYIKLDQYREEQVMRFVTKGMTAFYSPLLASLFPNRDVKRSDTVLFFSEVIDLMLRVDVNFFNKKYISECDRFRWEAYMWGTAYRYLFIFNEDGAIRKVLWSEMMLN